MLLVHDSHTAYQNRDIAMIPFHSVDIDKSAKLLNQHVTGILEIVCLIANSLNSYYLNIDIRYLVEDIINFIDVHYD